MDKVGKSLLKFTKKEREKIRVLLEKIDQRKFKELNLKKLKGRDDIFRVRKGDIRIVYRETGKQIFILSIERKTEKTYKHF